MRVRAGVALISARLRSIRIRDSSSVLTCAAAYSAVTKPSASLQSGLRSGLSPVQVAISCAKIVGKAPRPLVPIDSGHVSDTATGA
jgi:hypothetical protein